MKRTSVILIFLVNICLTAFIANAISSETPFSTGAIFLTLLSLSFIVTIPQGSLAMSMSFSKNATLSPIAKQLAALNANTGMSTNADSAMNSGIITPQGDHKFNNIAHMLSANVYNVPDAVTIVATSTSAVGSLPTRIFLFSQDNLQNITTNGGGAGTIAYAYEDGSATGATVSEIIGGVRDNVGGVCYGVSLNYTTTPVGGAPTANPNGVSGSAPAFLINTGFAFPIPLNLSPTSNQTRKDTNFGIGVYPVVTNIPRFAQFSCIIPANAANVGQVDTLTATFYFTPNYTI